MPCEDPAWQALSGTRQWPGRPLHVARKQDGEKMRRPNSQGRLNDLLVGVGTHVLFIRCPNDFGLIPECHEAPTSARHAKTNADRKAPRYFLDFLDFLVLTSVVAKSKVTLSVGLSFVVLVVEVPVLSVLEPSPANAGDDKARTRTAPRPINELSPIILGRDIPVSNTGLSPSGSPTSSFARTSSMY